MGRLDGKIAIITGAAQGMGEAHARRFINEGAKVVLADILEEKGQALASELGENAKFIKVDVTNQESWENVVAETEKTFGAINILVNNVGITTRKSIEETSLDDYQKIVNLNQISVFLGMKTTVSSMKKTENASIINVSSINGLQGGAIGYTDTKFAVRGMTKAAALEFADQGIRVNSVHPGAVETPMVAQADTSAAVEEFVKGIPNKRMAKPEEISNLILFLASDESQYSTGSEFVMDGGVTA